ncbi:MAG: hypothetical protein ACP59X_11820 [Solidesulfovibrio sp. DCME]|uniref:hypothetical protein n=1 Tax=Solidesulfovibrio sp. DCME TaxID=3447380 RepID=UPI003D09F17A
MGHDVQHPMLARLKLALEAKGEFKAARRLDLAALYYPQENQAGVRSLVLRHCREYGLAPEDIAGQDLAHPAPGRVTLTPVFAMASTNPRTGCWRLDEIERIALSSHLLGPTRFVTRMDSRALEPRIRLGAYLVVDTAQDLPPAASHAQLPPEAEGTPFAMDIKDEGLVVRLTRYDAGHDSWELAALDQSVPPMVVPRQNEGCRLVGRVVWVAQEF